MSDVEYKVNNNENVWYNDYAQYNTLSSGCALSPIASDYSLVIQDTQFPLECKSLIIQHAVNKSPAQLIWGGDISQSVMGDPVMSSEVFSYIREHPWIQIYSINDLTNDSVIIPFKTRMAREFGSLKLNVDFKNGEEPYIIQLLNEKDAVAEQRILNGPEQIEFTFINAGKYKLKAIRDRNKNNRWDTGDYLKKLQPEEVFVFQETIEIRANWDVEQIWSL